MIDVISDAVREAFHGHNAQDILKIISAHVWNRIEYARTRKGFRIYETTITQELLHYTILAAKESKFNIKLFEAESEKTNGNDIECFIETESGFVLLPMQAKIIYKNSRYDQMSHKVGNKEQIDLLIDRNDQTINLFEVKFYNEAFIMTKAYAENLRDKMGVFRHATQTKKQLSWVFLSTFGLKPNQHSASIIYKDLTMDDLFA